jgi:O-antigen/teichoic acid export membrane protein
VYAGVIGLGSARIQRQTQLQGEDAVRFTRESVRTLLLASSGFCVISAIGSYPLILIAFGHPWIPAVKLVVVLVLGRAIIAPEQLLRTLLERIAAPWYASAASLAGLVVALAGTALLTWWLGVMGAAVASVLGYGTYGLALWRLIRRARRQPLDSQFPASPNDTPVGAVHTMPDEIASRW